MKIATILVIVAFSCLACTANITTLRYESALLSQQVAERTYQLLYAAYTDGRLSDEELASADARYRVWQVAQQRYISAAHAGLKDISTEAAEVQVTLAALLFLANLIDVERGP